MSDQVNTEQDDQTAVTTESVTTTRLKPWKAFLIITLVLGGVFPLIAYVGYKQYQQAGFNAVLIAALLCWVGSIIGIIPALLVRDSEQPKQGVNAVLVGMLIRMSIPLGGGFFLHQSVEKFADAKILMFTLIYYLIALIVDTILTLKIVQANKPNQANKSSHIPPTSNNKA